MENKEIRDKLDDYVQRSFEGYEESPPPGMWERVEGDLPPAKQPKTFRRKTVAVAVAILLCTGLVCEHYYYEQKIEALKAEKSEMLGRSPEKPEANDGYVLEKRGQEVVSRNDIPYTQSIAPRYKSNSLKYAHQTAFGQQLAEGKNESGLDAAPATDAPPTAPSGEENFFPNKEIAANDILSPTPEIAEVEPLVTKFEPVSFSIVSPKPRPVAAPIKPVRNPSGWYLGLQITPYFTLENNTSITQAPGARPVFVSSQETPQFSAECWLKAGRKITSRWALESGAGLRSVERSTVHTARFRVGDGSGSQIRQFTYDLRSYGGSAAVNLRAEQVDPNATVPNNERVAFRISTKERLQILRLPLLAVCRFPLGRWQGVAKMGFVGNVVLKNQLDVRARGSQNPRFRLAQSGDALSLQYQKAGDFFMGYWMSAGAEFRLNRHLSLYAEPSFSGDFARKDATQQRLPGMFTVGLNIGANYGF